MDSVLDRQIVLSLNASWQPIGWRTVRQAMIALNGGAAGNPPAIALDIQLDEEGKLLNAAPMKWDQWAELEVRPNDEAIQTKNKAIRVPRAIISCNYNKNALKAAKLSKKAIRERDGGRCQYSGEVVGPNDGNVDHVIPRDRGGRDTWDNLVWSKKEINSKKGNKLNHEAGLVLRSQPKQPKPLPVSVVIGPAKRPEQKPFLIK